MVLLDMEMPESCKDCRINVYGRCGALRTSVLQEMVNEERNDNCPIKAELPKNATNGDVIKAMFPTLETRTNNDDFINYTFDGVVGHCVEKKWWNAKWKGQKNE